MHLHRHPDASSLDLWQPSWNSNNFRPVDENGDCVDTTPSLYDYSILRLPVPWRGICNTPAVDVPDHRRDPDPDLHLDMRTDVTVIVIVIVGKDMHKPPGLQRG